MQQKSSDKLFRELVKIKDEINQQIPLASNRYEQFECCLASITDEEVDKRFFEFEEKLQKIAMEYHVFCFTKDIVSDFAAKNKIAISKHILTSSQKDIIRNEAEKKIGNLFEKMHRTNKYVAKINVDLDKIQKYVTDNLDLILNKIVSHEPISTEHKEFEERNLKTNKLLELRKTYGSQSAKLLIVKNLLKNRDEDKSNKISDLLEAILLDRLKIDVGFCGEHTLLALIRMFKLFLVNSDTTIEKVKLTYLDDNRNCDDNHTFLAINRDPESKLNHIPSWGKNAILLDPWNKLVCKAEDYESLPLRYFSYPPGLIYEGVEHCVKWASTKFDETDYSLLDDLEREDLFVRITSKDGLAKRELSLMEEYGLISLSHPNLNHTKVFLDQLLPSVLPDGFNMPIELYITTSGNQLVRPLPGFLEPKIAIHKEFLNFLVATTENQSSVEELKFGLANALYQIKHQPLDFEKITNFNEYDRLAIEKCGNGTAAISYLQKSNHFENLIKDKDFEPHIYNALLKTDYGFRIKYINTLIAENEKLRENVSQFSCSKEMLNEVIKIPVVTYFDHDFFASLTSNVEKITYLKSCLPLLKEEFIPYEFIQRPSIRLKEFCVLIRQINIDLSNKEQVNTVDSLINAAFELKISGFERIYIATHNIDYNRQKLDKKRPLRPLGTFKDLQRSLNQFVCANNYKTALSAAKKLLKLFSVLKTHFIRGHLPNYFDKEKLIKDGQRFFCSQIGHLITWASFNWQDFLIVQTLPEILKPNSYYFINNATDYNFFRVDEFGNQEVLQIREVENLSYILSTATETSRGLLEDDIKKCIAKFILKQTNRLPWDNHIQWLAKDKSRTIAKALMLSGVARDTRMWEFFSFEELKQYITEPQEYYNKTNDRYNDCYVYPIVELEGQFEEYGDGPTYFNTSYEMIKYFSKKHPLKTNMFNSSNTFEEAFIQFYDRNQPVLICPGKRFNECNDAVKFLISKFVAVALNGTDAEKKVIKSFFLGREDKRDLEHLRHVNFRCEPMSYDGPYIEFFILQSFRNERFSPEFLAELFSDIDLAPLKIKFADKYFTPMFSKITEKDYVSLQIDFENGMYDRFLRSINNQITKLILSPKFRGQKFKLFTLDETIRLYNKISFFQCDLSSLHYLIMFDFPCETITFDCIKRLIPLLIEYDLEFAAGRVLDHYVKHIAKPYSLMSHEAATICEFINDYISHAYYTSVRNKWLSLMIMTLPNSVTDISFISCDELITIYRTLDNYLQFKSFEQQQQLGDLILEKIQLLPCKEQITFFKKLIYTSKFSLPLSDIQLRNKIVQTWVSNLLAKHGKDKNQDHYRKIFEDIISEIHNNTPNRDVIYLLSELANAIETQAPLSEFIGMKLEPEKYLVTGQLIKYSFRQVKTKREENLIILAQFLGKKKEDRLQLLNFLSSPLTRLSLSDFAQYLIDHKKVAPLIAELDNQSRSPKLDKPSMECIMQSMYHMFWYATLQQRTVVIDYLLISSDSVTGEQECLQAYEEAFFYVTNKLFPKANPNHDEYDENENFAVAFLKAYLDTTNKFMKNYLLASLLVTNNQIDKSNASVGKKFAVLLEYLGPAYLKLAQAIHSYPYTPENIRKDLEHVKGRANPPTRWQLWRLIKEVLDKKELGKIELLKNLLGCASFNIATAVKLQSSEAVLLLLRENAEKDTQEGFTHLLAALNACDHSKMNSIRESAITIINEAKELSVREMDQKSGDLQGEIAATMYQSLLDITIDDIKYQIQFFTSDTIQSGPGYRFITRVYGTEFNDLPENTPQEQAIKKAIAKAVITVELLNIFSGDNFDCDRHGNQLKVVINRKAKIIEVGLYDFGEMSLETPTEIEISQLAKFILNIPSLTKNNEHIALSFSNYITELNKRGEPTRYLMHTRKAILALQDFQKHLDSDELFEIFKFISTNARVHTAIKAAFFVSQCSSLLINLISKAKSMYQSISSRCATVFLGKRHEYENKVEEDSSDNLNQQTKKIKLSPILFLGNRIGHNSNKKRKTTRDDEIDTISISPSGK